MNVGLVLPGFSADVADWCIPALRHFARALATSDDVRVIALRYPYRAGRYEIDGAQVFAVGGAKRRGAGTLTVWRKVLGLVQAEHRRHRFDVLHAFWATESGLLAALAGGLLRIPTLVSLAGGELVALRDIDYGDQRVAWERLKVRASLRLASDVSAGSRQMVAYAGRHVASPHRLHRAPLGVDLDLFVSGARGAAGSLPANHRQRVVHVGTLTPVKDHVTLLRAFADVQRQGICATLEIVGDGPLRSDLERIARDLGVSDSILFRGAIDHAALPTVYRDASAFVLSSRHEAQGMVALEAAACGVPVLGTRVGIIPELTTAVAPVGDHRALAQAIATALTDTSTHLQDSQAALQTVHEEFDLRRCTDRFRSLYATLVSA